MHWIYAHLIGDYILQNDWMAANKKKDKGLACLVHVATYMIPFFFCGLTSVQLFMIAWQHFMIDRTYFVIWSCSITGRRNFMKPPMAPWSIILMDNIYHILWIAFIVWIWKIFNINI